MTYGRLTLLFLAILLNATAEVFPLLAIAAIAPFILFLSLSPAKNAVWGGILFGVSASAWNIRWFFDAYPLAWAGIEKWWIAILLIGACWLLTAFFLGIPYGIFAYGAKYFDEKTLFSPFLLASLWTVSEYVRAWLFTLLWAGPGAAIGPYWTFGAMGYSLVASPLLLQSAKLFGLWGSSFLVLLANAAVAALIVNLRTGAKKSALVGAIIMALFLYGTWVFRNEEQEERKTAVLIQTDFPARYQVSIAELRAFVERELTLLRKAKTLNPDIIVLPEESRLSLIFGQETGYVLAVALGNEKSITIVDSARMSEFTRSPERTFFYDTAKGLVGISDKTILIPGGEYLPYLITLPAKLFGFSHWTDEFTNVRAVVPAKRATVTNNGEGVAQCAGIISPKPWQELANGGARILLNPSSVSILRESAAFSRQTERMARFFAAAEDRWFLRAANSGYSYAINNRGAIRKKTSSLGEAILSAQIEYRTTMPFSRRIGDWVLFPMILHIFSLGIRRVIHTKKTGNSAIIRM